MRTLNLNCGVVLNPEFRLGELGVDDDEVACRDPLHDWVDVADIPCPWCGQGDPLALLIASEEAEDEDGPMPETECDDEPDPALRRTDWAALFNRSPEPLPYERYDALRPRVIRRITRPDETHVTDRRTLHRNRG